MKKIRPYQIPLVVGGIGLLLTLGAIGLNSTIKDTKKTKQTKQTGIELYVNRDINHDGIIDYVQGREGRAFISQPDGHFAKADIVRTNGETRYQFNDGSYMTPDGITVKNQRSRQ